MPNSRYSLEWGRDTEKGILPKIISGSAFIPTLYRLFSWNLNVQYKITGMVHKVGDDSVLIFCADDATLSIDKLDFEQEEIKELTSGIEKPRKRRRRITAYPKEWAGSFGVKYYESQARERAFSSEIQSDELDLEHTTYTSEEENVTTPIQAANEIKEILEELGVDDES